MARVAALAVGARASCPHSGGISRFEPGDLAPNTDRAYTGDLRYYQAWCKAALGRPLSYPVTAVDVLRFIEDHTGGMTPEVDASLVDEGIKGRPGRHAVSTIHRRVLALGRSHRLQGLPNPCDDPSIKRALRRAAKRAASMPVRRHKPINGEVLDALLATCDDTLRGQRDRALLLVAFASGGRRRSEVAAIEYAHLTRVGEGYLLRIPHGKTDQEGRGLDVPVQGAATRALDRWLETSGIRGGRVFRRIRPDGALAHGLSDKAVARMIKRRVSLAGLDPLDFSAHSIRSGFITEAGRRQISLGDAMALSGHRTVAVALRYHHAGEVLCNPAARLLP